MQYRGSHSSVPLQRARANGIGVRTSISCREETFTRAEVHVLDIDIIGHVNACVSNTGLGASFQISALGSHGWVESKVTFNHWRRPLLYTNAHRTCS